MRIYTAVFIIVMSMVMGITLDAQVNSATMTDSLGKVGQLKADSLLWKYKTTMGAGFNAVELTNWSAGGQDAITFRVLFLGQLDYAEDMFSWENDLDIGYSLSKQGSDPFKKADDRLIFGTKLSRKQNDWLRYTAFVDFRTQFAVGYNYDIPDSTSPTGDLIISNFMAPGYLTGALGAEWTPVPEFKLLVAPISSRTVFVLDQPLADSGAFGVDRGQNIANDFGALINSTLDWEFVENVRLKSTLNAFCRYEAFDLWIVTFENAILMKVNSFLSVGFLTSVFYDDKVPVIRDDGTKGPATQLKNQLTIDFTWSVANFE